MRIISGTCGGRKIVVPKSITRPSTDRLREALFSILGDYVDVAAVLDLFAGSGAIGLECLSRGAKTCTFVDSNKDACRVISQNLKTLGLTGGNVQQLEAERLLGRRGGIYDLIFADPPYYKNSTGTDHVQAILEAPFLQDMLAPEGLLIIEDDPSNKRTSTDKLELIDQRRYGGCGILIYRPLNH